MFKCIEFCTELLRIDKENDMFQFLLPKHINPLFLVGTAGKNISEPLDFWNLPLGRQLFSRQSKTCQR